MLVIGVDEMHRILEAILKSSYFEEAIKGRDIDIEIEGYGYQLSDTDFKLEVLENFFYEDEKVIFSVEPLWQLLKTKIKFDVDRMLTDPETFVKEWRTSFKELAEEFLNNLQSNLLDEYRELLDAEWSEIGLDEAKKRLPKNQQYVALLDENGNLTREPIPITRRMEAKISCCIKVEEIKRIYGTVKQRNLHVTSDIPFVEGEQCSRRIIALRDNEVAAVIIKT